MGTNRALTNRFGMLYARAERSYHGDTRKGPVAAGAPDQLPLRSAVWLPNRAAYTAACVRRSIPIFASRFDT
jgi:hypothetical protein